MIDQALNSLTLHIIWKARRLSAVIQPSPDDGRLRESFREQREALLKRLVEYAVGSQSNPTDGIRRGASTPLLSQKSYLTPVRFVGLPEPS
jgi:cohesin complex subunit SA-1/2